MAKVSTDLMLYKKEERPTGFENISRSRKNKSENIFRHRKNK
jgi:hypothetical protein